MAYDLLNLDGEVFRYDVETQAGELASWSAWAGHIPVSQTRFEADVHSIYIRIWNDWLNEWTNEQRKERTNEWMNEWVNSSLAGEC